MFNLTHNESLEKIILFVMPANTLITWRLCEGRSAGIQKTFK